MATYTTNYGLSKPDNGDQFSAFRTSYNQNMDIIDQNLGGGGGSSSLAGLNDVSLTAPSDGQVLTYDANSSEWINANAGGGGSSTLAGLTDVSINTPITNDALIYDGAEWANTPLADVALSGDYTDLINTPTIPTTLGALVDVTVTTPSNGEILKYDGMKWINDTLSVPSDLDDLSDVTITTPSDGEVLKYDSNSGEWINSPDNVGDTVTWNQITATGTKIAEININGATTDVYAPTGGGGSYTAGDGIDITGSTISLAYLSVVSGKVCIVYDDGN